MRCAGKSLDCREGSDDGRCEGDQTRDYGTRTAFTRDIDIDRRTEVSYIRVIMSHEYIAMMFVVE